MSTEVTIPADAYQEYWVGIRVNGVLLRVQIDTGMTQAACEVGLGLASDEFDRLGPILGEQQFVEHLVAGRPSPMRIRTAIGHVSIDGLDGSEVETHIARIDANLIGVCFFHRLPGFELHWDLASRMMTLRRIG